METAVRKIIIDGPPSDYLDRIYKFTKIALRKFGCPGVELFPDMDKVWRRLYDSNYSSIRAEIFSEVNKVNLRYSAYLNSPYSLIIKDGLFYCYSYMTLWASKTNEQCKSKDKIILSDKENLHVIVIPSKMETITRLNQELFHIYLSLVDKLSDNKNVIIIKEADSVLPMQLSRDLRNVFANSKDSSLSSVL